MVIAKQIAAAVNDMYLRTSIVFIVSITVLLSLVWSFFQFSNGLFGLYPEGQVPLSCSRSNGSGADDEIILAVLHLLDLSRFSAAPSARLSHLPFESDRAFPAQC